MADLSETKRHLLGVLKTELDSQYKFQVPFNTGATVVQRIRVELTRVKQAYAKHNAKLKKLGKPTDPAQQFKLHAVVTPFRETDGTGDAYDEVVLTRSQTGVQVQSRSMAKLFQAMVAPESQEGESA